MKSSGFVEESRVCVYAWEPAVVGMNSFPERKASKERLSGWETTGKVGET